MCPEVKGALIALLVLLAVVLCLGLTRFGLQVYEILQALIHSG